MGRSSSIEDSKCLKLVSVRERVYYNPTLSVCLGELYGVLGEKNTLALGWPELERSEDRARRDQENSIACLLSPCHPIRSR
jgi:hypothetical protein